MKARQGAAAVEFALVALPLMLLLMGALELGRAWMTYGMLTHAVRDAARQAAVQPGLQPNDPRVLARLNATLAGMGLAAQTSAVQFTSPLITGRLVRVRAEARFQPVVALLFAAGRQQMPLQAEVTTRYEL